MSFNKGNGNLTARFAFRISYVDRLESCRLEIVPMGFNSLERMTPWAIIYRQR